MYSLKLGAAWVLDAALSAVPLRVTVLVPTTQDRDTVLDAIVSEYHSSSTLAEFNWHKSLNRIDVGRSVIYFFFANRPDELRGRQFDYIWAADTGRYDEHRRNEVLSMLPLLLRDPRAGTFEENVLVTY